MQMPKGASDHVALTSIRFRKYKALTDFSLKLDEMNVMVGPNNAGKSTVIGAVRLLAVAIARARRTRPERVPSPTGRSPGWRIPGELAPISLENVHTDYAEEPSTITFRLSNGNELVLYFAADGGCSLVPMPRVGTVTDTSIFRAEFPITVGYVPVLGPLEHKEHVVTEETVRRGLTTHLASRHFRNYWRYYPTGFAAFQELVETSWPGMSIQLPEASDDGRVYMFCREDRIDREMYWAGFGFQVWCQTLTHLNVHRDTTLIVIDEPEIYLHPDLQRQLVAILRDLDPDILLATHSAEIVAETDPSELVIIDKRAKSGRRLQDAEGVADALRRLGSAQNVALTQLARSRRVLFVEGQDFKILRRLAARLGLSELASGAGITPFPVGGFPEPSTLAALARGIRQALGIDVGFAGVFDRDYRPDEEVGRVETALEEELSLTHIYRRKELENYLLIPKVLDRAVTRALRNRKRRTGKAIPAAPDSSDMLTRITEKLKLGVVAQLTGHESRLPSKTGYDVSTINKAIAEAVEDKWSDLSYRFDIVPGKAVLAQFNAELQAAAGVSLSQTQIVEAMAASEIPHEMARLLRDLDRFRKKTFG
jgi:energy-coupling factor transporter ATP-binding protein EcfA2